MTNIPLREWLRKYDAGDFKDASFETQCDAGWYDWFCDTSQLLGKLERMVGKVKQVATSPKVNIDTMYVWFKNNCPMWTNKLYDDFRIADLETGDVVFCVVPKYPKAVKDGNRKNPFNMETKNVSELFDGASGKTVVSGTWREVKKWLEI